MECWRGNQTFGRLNTDEDIFDIVICFVYRKKRKHKDNKKKAGDDEEKADIVGMLMFFFVF